MKKSKNDPDTTLSGIPSPRTEDLIIQKTESELLVYDLKTNRAICLNETSALVWQSCDGKRDVSEIAKIVENVLGHPVEKELIWFALNQLQKENLLEGGEIFAERFSGISRREVIRKVGLTSVIALPIVSSLVAPSSAHAQSCVGMGANFPPGQVTAGGTYPGGVCDPMDGLGFCAPQGVNCCTAVATITCTVPGTAPFTCNCT